jgi:hypothetical protein
MPLANLLLRRGSFSMREIYRAKIGRALTNHFVVCNVTPGDL